MPGDVSPAMRAACTEVEAALEAARELLFASRKRQTSFASDPILNEPDAVVSLAKLILERTDRAAR